MEDRPDFFLVIDETKLGNVVSYLGRCFSAYEARCASQQLLEKGAQFWHLSVNHGFTDTADTTKLETALNVIKSLSIPAIYASANLDHFEKLPKDQWAQSKLGYKIGKENISDLFENSVEFRAFFQFLFANLWLVLGERIVRWQTGKPPIIRVIVDRLPFLSKKGKRRIETGERFIMSIGAGVDRFIIELHFRSLPSDPSNTPEEALHGLVDSEVGAIGKMNRSLWPSCAIMKSALIRLEPEKPSERVKDPFPTALFANLKEAHHVNLRSYLNFLHVQARAGKLIGINDARIIRCRQRAVRVWEQMEQILAHNKTRRFEGRAPRHRGA